MTDYKYVLVDSSITIQYAKDINTYTLLPIKAMTYTVQEDIEELIKRDVLPVRSLGPAGGAPDGVLM